MDQIENKKNVDLLKNIILGGNVYGIFAGAGTSMPLGNLDWDALLYKLGKKHHIPENIIKGFLEKDQYPEAASYIFKQINNEKLFSEYLKELFSSPNVDATTLHIDIIKKFNLIFTTNYDNAFEVASKREKENFKIQKFPYFNPFTLMKNKTIIYLHGNNDEGLYVFKKSEYDAYYPSVKKGKNVNPIRPSYELENFLKYIFSLINLVFIGFSFKDKYFINFLTKTIFQIKEQRELYRAIFKKEHPHENVEHFAIVPENFENMDKLNELNIKIINYSVGKHFGSPKHRDISLILNSLFDEPTDVTSLHPIKEAANV